MAAAPSTDEKNASAPPPAPRGPLARRWLLNLVLLIVVAGIGVFAWYRGAQPPAESKPRLTELRAEAVQTIEITRLQQPRVRLERGDGGWRLTAPIVARADTFAVNALLRLLQAPVDGDIAPSDKNLARYGLEPPQLSVRFDTAEINFGERHPLKDQQYVKHGPVVQLISGQYFVQAAVRYTNLIDSRLIEPGRKLVSLKLQDFTLTLQDDAWQRAPEIAALSSDRINAFIDEWRHARALQIQTPTEKKIAQTVVIAFENPDGSKSELQIGVLARQPELVLYRPDENLEYRFPADTAERMLHLKAEDSSPKSEPDDRKTNTGD